MRAGARRLAPAAGQTPAVGERLTAAPAPNLIVGGRRDKYQAAPMQPFAAELRGLYSTARGRSVAHTSDKGNVGCAPLPRERRREELRLRYCRMSGEPLY